MGATYFGVEEGGAKERPLARAGQVDADAVADAATLQRRPLVGNGLHHLPVAGRPQNSQSTPSKQHPVRPPTTTHLVHFTERNKKNDEIRLA